MHLLHSGVDITLIALWLGHESTATTHIYVEADLKMKEAALKVIFQRKFEHNALVIDIGLAARVALTLDGFRQVGLNGVKHGNRLVILSMVLRANVFCAATFEEEKISSVKDAGVGGSVSAC